MKHPFLFISLAAVLNVLLDVLFVFGFPMGCMGAALATVISQGASFIVKVHEGANEEPLHNRHWETKHQKRNNNF